jgi:predicted metalloprotease
MNREYTDPKLVLFSGSVQSACGMAGAAVGPFYCPGDHKLYLDTSFFRDLRDRFGAPGDFAQAYVIAHEMGHHVQNLLGIDDQVRRQMDQSPDQQNELSVRQELQADCFAGVWAHSTYERGMLEKGDLQEGLRAASAVGDDRLQQQAGGRVNPETWTHGSSQQRETWFDRGFTSGSPDDCDTFNGDI